MCVVPVLMATLSSPLSIQLCAIVMFVDDPGSMPSVFLGRGSFGPGSCTGVFRCTPHAVNPSVRDTPTWKFGESCSVIRYMVKPSAFAAEISRGSLYGIPAGRASVGSPCTASPHHETFWPSSFAPPRPSITPSPIIPTFFARIVMNALHGPFDGMVPHVAGRATQTTSRPYPPAASRLPSTLEARSGMHLHPSRPPPVLAPVPAGTSPQTHRHRNGRPD